MGQKDLSQAQPYALWDLTEGLQADRSDVMVDEKACVAGTSNFVGFEGKLRRRDGFTEVLSDLGGTLSAAHYANLVEFGGSTAKCCLALDLGTNAVTLYERTGATWTNRNGAIVLSGSETRPMTSATFKGNLYFTTGNNNLHVWATAGGNIAAVTNGDATLVPFATPRIVRAWDGRLWLLDCQDGAGNQEPQRVAWSDLLLDNVWKNVGATTPGSAGFQSLYDEDPGDIVGALDTRDNLVIYKPNTVYLASFVDEPKYYEVKPLARGIGLGAARTLQRFRESLVWFGEENVYTLSGNQIEPLANGIRTRIYNQVNLSALSRGVGIVDDLNLLYWLFLPAAGTTLMTKVFIFSLRGGSWWEGTIAGSLVQPVCGFTQRESAWDRSLIVGSRTGSFFEIDSAATNDGGSTAKFTNQWDSKIFDAQQLSGGKFETAVVDRISVYATSGKIKVTLRYGPALDLLKTLDLGELSFNGKGAKLNLPANVGDKFMQVRFSHADMTSPAQVEGMMLHIKPRGSVKLA